MADSWAQADSLIASNEDRAAKLQNLEREVFVIKTTIKSLLINIRDSLNDQGYSQTSSYAISPSGQTRIEPELNITSIAESAFVAKKAALEARESLLDMTEAVAETKPAIPSPSNGIMEAVLYPGTQKRLFQRPHISEDNREQDSPGPDLTDRLQLQKLHQIFRWTNGAVEKFGHDRLTIMLESYCVMGYLPRNKADQIREMSRIMPANLGDAHELGPDEFVYEIYALNRIFAPEDTTFDRDMIEVLMEQRQQDYLARKQPASGRSKSAVKGSERKQPKGYQIVEEWINLPI